MKHKGFVRVIINTLLIIVIASTIGFTTGYMVTPSTIIPISLLRKFTGEDGKVYYKIMLSKDYSTVVADSSLTTGGNGTSGDNSSGDNSGTGESPSVTPSTPITNHQHVAYFQKSYGDSISNGHTVSGSGCGLCSFSSMMAEAGYGNGMDPVKWLEYFDSKNNSIRNYWSGGSMAWSFPTSIPTILNNDGSFGHWENCAKIEGQSAMANDAFATFVKTHLEEGDYILISAEPGLFTGTGHIMFIPDFADEEHNKIHIVDSSPVCAKHLFGQGSVENWQNANKLSFPLNSEEQLGVGYKGNNGAYQIKCVWALKHTN